MQINDKVKDIIEKPEYRTDLDREFVDNILRDAYNENVWDERNRCIPSCNKKCGESRRAK